MKKLIALILALSWAVPALAQPVPGPGPGPVPDPWVLNGSTLSWDQGGLALPSTVTGGGKGVGTINVSGGYYTNNVLIGQPGGFANQVQTNSGTGGFSGITNTQLTALINLATTSLPGAMPPFPNTTTTYFRGDATFQTLNCAAISNAGTACTANTGTSGATVPFLNGANTWSAVQTVNLNAASLPTALTGTALRVGQADTVIGRLEIDTFGTASPGVLSITHGRGTGASPTAVQSGDELGSFNTWGYTGAGTLSGTAVAAFRTYAAENFSSGHQGSKACFGTTPTASTTLTDSMCQQPSGGVLIAAPTGGDQGAGTLNATGLFVNGVAVNTSTANVASVSNSDGTLTISPTTGAVVASLALGHVNTWSAAQTFSSGISAGNSTLTGTLTAASLSTVGTIGGSLCSTSGGLILFESGINCFAATASSITVGTTTIASGTSGRVEFNNAGVLGEYSITGTAGSVVMSNAPTIAGETVSGTANFTGTFQFGGNTQTFPGVAATLAALTVSGQNVTGGASFTTQVQSAGSLASDCSTRPGQTIPNTGAWTLTAPALDGNCALQVVNLAGAATPTYADFSKLTPKGDGFSTADTSNSTVTVTSASPGVVSWTAHGLVAETIVYFSNSGGSLPTGLSAATEYYVCKGATLLTNSFAVATTRANALAGTCVNTSSTGTGTQTAHQASVFLFTIEEVNGLATGIWTQQQ